MDNGKLASRIADIVKEYAPRIEKLDAEYKVVAEEYSTVGSKKNALQKRINELRKNMADATTAATMDSR